MNEHEQEVIWLVNEKYGGCRTARAERDMERLSRGEHIDYVVGKVDFLGLSIDLSQKPFIPRPETAFWVERAIGHIRAKEEPSLLAQRTHKEKPSLLWVLDMFAGSGCVGLAVRKHILGSRVVFGEREDAACRQIEINIRQNALDPWSCEIVCTNMFERVEGTFDYIFANPPYIPETRREEVQESVLRNEPEGALFGGEDGLRYIVPFLKDAKKFLSKGGGIFMEFHPGQEQDIGRLLKEYGYGAWEFHRDQFGQWRYAIIQ